MFRILQQRAVLISQEVVTFLAASQPEHGYAHKARAHTQTHTNTHIHRDRPKVNTQVRNTQKLPKQRRQGIITSPGREKHPAHVYVLILGAASCVCMSVMCLRLWACPCVRVWAFVCMFVIDIVHTQTHSNIHRNKITPNTHTQERTVWKESKGWKGFLQV